MVGLYRYPDNNKVHSSQYSIQVNTVALVDLQ